MPDPMVVCVMLTRDRPEMAARALRCFEAQTYGRKRLLVVNSGPTPLFKETENIWEPCFVGADAMSIGELRNLGCRFAAGNYAKSAERPDIIIHWDDDDWSHPFRISEQVALLQQSGAEAVGYHDLLFWDTSRKPKHQPFEFEEPGETWLYTAEHPTYFPGTSACYWRSTWERKPFADVSVGEDMIWWTGLKTAVATSLMDRYGMPMYGWRHRRIEPRMIASIHGGNTASRIDANAAKAWRRVPEWDSCCREVMAL